MSDQTLIQKIQGLPPDRLVEVEGFVDFLRTRVQDRAPDPSAVRTSEDPFRQVWDNPDDAEYDRL